MLERAGHEVWETADGREGSRALREGGADAVLCDVFMPECDGPELVERLRADRPGLHVVSMSGGGFGGQIDLLPVARRLGAAACPE